jgi:hypothetical protein
VQHSSDVGCERQHGDRQIADARVKRLGRRRDQTYSCAGEKRRTFQCRSDAEQIAVVKLAELLLQVRDESAETAEEREACADLEPQRAGTRCLRFLGGRARNHGAAELIRPSSEPIQRRALGHEVAFQHRHVGMDCERRAVIHAGLEVRALGSSVGANDPARVAGASRHDDRPTGFIRTQSFQGKLGQGNAKPEHGNGDRSFADGDAHATASAAALDDVDLQLAVRFRQFHSQRRG